MEPAHEASPKSSHLTPRERDVLRLIMIGQTDKQIAHALGISPRTASNHVASILRKLGVETRAGARRWANRNGVAATDMVLAATPSLGADPAVSQA